MVVVVVVIVMMVWTTTTLSLVMTQLMNAEQLKPFFDVLLTVHLSFLNIFISLFHQLDAQNLFHNKFYFMPLHV